MSWLEFVRPASSTFQCSLRYERVNNSAGVTSTRSSAVAGAGVLTFPAIGNFAGKANYSCSLPANVSSSPSRLDSYRITQ
ncbi:MAG: hypothetical protein ACT4QA_10265 [Panacagrimonas sp.]